MWKQGLFLAVFGWHSIVVRAFVFGPHFARQKCTTAQYSTVDDSAPSDVAEDYESNSSDTFSFPILSKVKGAMLKLGASYDRGFGASSRARKEGEKLITELESLNREAFAAEGIDGKGGKSPLTGNWRMIWTTASDVLVLGANPAVTAGAIYQIFEPPIVTNVIDFIPRIQNLLPPSIAPPSLLRAKVKTRASTRMGKPMRVGLDFESVELKPVEFMGNDASVLPPLGFDLPRLFELPDDVGYFDVTYLDEDLLVIRQNAPGGLFVLTRVDDASP